MLFLNNKEKKFELWIGQDLNTTIVILKPQ